jgi:hypothetical protein
MNIQARSQPRCCFSPRPPTTMCRSHGAAACDRSDPVGNWVPRAYDFAQWPMPGKFGTSLILGGGRRLISPDAASHRGVCRALPRQPCGCLAELQSKLNNFGGVTVWSSGQAQTWSQGLPDRLARLKGPFRRRPWVANSPRGSGLCIGWAGGDAESLSGTAGQHSALKFISQRCRR